MKQKELDKEIYINGETKDKDLYAYPKGTFSIGNAKSKSFSKPKQIKYGFYQIKGSPPVLNREQIKEFVSKEPDKYPSLKDMTIFELAQLRIEAEKYNDKEFVNDILLEFKRRVK